MQIGSQDIRRWGNLKIESNLDGVEQLDAFLEECKGRKIPPYSVPKYYVDRMIPKKYTGIFKLLHYCEPLIIESSVDEVVQRRFRNSYKKIILNYCNDLGYSQDVYEKLSKAGTLLILNESLYDKYDMLFNSINSILIWGVKLEKELYSLDESKAFKKIIDGIIAKPFDEWIADGNLYYMEE